jgi:uncharacterized glyoxalase superfamily protein PhnB
MKRPHLLKKAVFLGLLFLLVSAFVFNQPSGRADWEFSGVIPQLVVRDVATSADFYRDRLGFEVLQRVKERDVLTYALLRSGSVALALQTERKVREDFPEIRSARPGSGANLIIRTNNVKALYDKVRGRATIVRELQTTFYGSSEFSLRDPNGYVLTFAQAAD